MTALAMMLFKELWIGWSILGEVLLWIAAILTFITGYQYYQKSLEYIKAEEAKKKSIKSSSSTTEKVITAKAKNTKASTKKSAKSTKKLQEQKQNPKKPDLRIYYA